MGEAIPTNWLGITTVQGLEPHNGVCRIGARVTATFMWSTPSPGMHKA